MPQEGDKVKVICEKEEFEGILMPRPNLLSKDITVVKLKTGYNIGIDKTKIKKIEVLEEYKKPKEKTHELKPKKGLPNITVISTGGTISSKIDYKTGGVYADYTAEDFVAMMPELKDVANLKAKKIMGIMSEDMSSKEWIQIAKAIESELQEADAVVLTQGTDTLHFTTAALSFLLQDLSKPVIVTAAQRSIDRGSSDAFMNLLCSIQAAAKFNAAEVMTCLHGSTNDDYCILNRGTKVRKMHTSRRDTFRPIGELPLAKINEKGEIQILNQNFKEKSGTQTNVSESDTSFSKTKAITKFEDKIALLHTYPGMRPDVLNVYKDYKGLVIAATGLGNIPQNLFDKIKELKLPIVIAAQTLYGRVHPLVYANLRELSIKLNCIYVEDMLPETAYIKLGYVLGQTNGQEKVKELMQTNIAGEITERSDTKSFLY